MADGMNFYRNRGTQIPRRTKRRIYIYKEFLRTRHLERINIRWLYPMKNRTCDEMQNKYRYQDKNWSSFRRGSVVFTVINSEDIAGRHGKGEFLFSHEKRDYGSTSGRRGRVGWKRKNSNVFSWLALWVDPENSFLNERLH